MNNAVLNGKLHSLFDAIAAFTLAILKICMARPSREWNDLPDVVQPSGKKDKSLKAQPKASMRNCTISA